ncbi:MAG: E3 ubiquitin ligase family protein [Elainellaceae cyanobacterium]
MGWLATGIVLLGIGLVLFFVQRSQRARSLGIKSARAATIAELAQMADEIAAEIGRGNWREYVGLRGTITCDRPLISELKQEPCVYYTMTVRRDYEETVIRKDSEGRSRREVQRGSEIVASNKRSIPFQLQDATGTITVNPEGAHIDSVDILNDFRPDQLSSRSLSYGNFSITVNTPITQGDRHTLGYRYSEAVLPVGRTVFVLAELSDEFGERMLQKPTQARQPFLISLKAPNELATHADRAANRAHYAMLICLVAGLVLVIVSLVVR